jgi:hypothetical protein
VCFSRCLGQFEKKNVFCRPSYSWIAPSTPFNLDEISVYVNKCYRTPKTIQRNHCNTGHTRRRKPNQKHNITYDGQHYMQTNKNNVNKTCALLQTTGGKDEPNIVLIRHAPSYKQLEVKTNRTSF